MEPIEKAVYEYIHVALEQQPDIDKEAFQHFQENNNLMPTSPTKKSQLKSEIRAFEQNINKLYYQVPNKSPVRTTIGNTLLEHIPIPKRASILRLSRDMAYKQKKQDNLPSITYYTLNLVSRIEHSHKP